MRCMRYQHGNTTRYFAEIRSGGQKATRRLQICLACEAVNRHGTNYESFIVVGQQHTKSQDPAKNTVPLAVSKEPCYAESTRVRTIAAPGVKINVHR